MKMSIERLRRIVGDAAHQESVEDDEVIEEAIRVLWEFVEEFSSEDEVRRGAVIILKVLCRYEADGEPGARIAGTLIRMVTFGMMRDVIGHLLGLHDSKVVEMMEFVRDWFLRKF